MTHPIVTNPRVVGEAVRLYAQTSTLFLSVSGSHLYGFESPNSDVDLRGCHVEGRSVLGIFGHKETREAKCEVGGLLVETSTHDVAKFCSLLLKRNGNALEQLFSPLLVDPPIDLLVISDAVLELRELAGWLITRNHAWPYRGFAEHEWRECMRTPLVKKLLYTFRTLLTGIYLMRSGAVIAHLPTLLDRYSGPADLGFLPDLIALKKERVETVGWFGAIEPYERAYVALQGQLDAAREASHLPEDARQVDKTALNAFVIRTRLERFEEEEG